jgi:DNA-cytosine methyltransferase
MNVLSLFDGMSCGRIALDRLGIKVDNYFASEIDKYAMQVSEANYPEIIQVGDITKLDLSTLPQIDLIMGGSPCQGFSFAGKQLAFDDPRSMLFFEFVRCIDTLKPKYFLLENVRMKKEYLDIISEYMGVEPIFINSSLVSAQSRQRYYWTNIPGIQQPQEKGIVLRDILETREIEGLSEKAIAYMNRGSEKYTGTKTRAEHYIKHESKKSNTLTANMYKGVPYGVIAVDKPLQVGEAVDINGHDVLKRVYSPEGKSPTVNTCQGGNREPKVVCGRYVGRYKVDGVRQDHKGSIAGKSKQMLELRRDDKTNNISTVQKDNVLVKDDVYWRKLTPLECERLQTVPDNYTNYVSNTQRYKMLGNGWTVDVIAHILKNMEL